MQSVNGTMGNGNEEFNSFVFIFSTMTSSDNDEESTVQVWNVTNEAYWWVEAILIFLILTATLTGNVYFCFTSRMAKRDGEAVEAVGQEEEATEEPSSDLGARHQVGQEEGPCSDVEAGPQGHEDQSGTKADGSSATVQSNSNAALVDRGAAVADSSGSKTAGASVSVVEDSVGAKIQEDRPAPKQRLHYLDNLKVALVVLVFLQHTAQGLVTSLDPTMDGLFFSVFSTLNSAWFMQLFFFISAYFVPTSLERKGAFKFLEDKLQRLGIPMLFVSILLAPFQAFAVASLSNKSYQYSILFGVAWFILWLQIFNLAYMALRALTKDKAPYSIKLPGNLKQLGFGALMGLLQGAIAFAQGGRWFAWGFLRLQWAYAPGYMSFFALGIMAP